MLRFVCILALVALASAFPKQLGKGKNHSHKIVGGHETTIAARPYQVSLILTDVKGDTYLCGGTIISKRWVLSAAHCFDNMIKIDVRAGSAELFSGGVVKSTSIYKIHPKYNTKTHDYDVAIVDLGQNTLPLNDNTIKAVSLASTGTKLPDDTPVTISGWGATSEGGSTSETLMEVEVRSVSSDTCKKSYNTITARMLCAGVPEGGKDSCQGDSGGPLVLSSNNTQVGIVSFGYGCARAGVPGVYSNVANLRSWIKSNTGV